MRKAVVIFLSFFLFAITSLSQAEEVPTPDSLDGCKIISVKEARLLVDNKNALFFDVRNPINYGRGHIPGALSLPFKGKLKKEASLIPNADSIDLSKLPLDKTKNIVFYSHGATGWKSYFAAKIAIQQGFKNVMWLRSGYSEWKSKYGTRK